MVVEALRHELQRERIFLTRGLLDLGPFVLEPDFDLSLVETELGTQLLATSFRQISVFSELVFQTSELSTGKRGPGTFVFCSGSFGARFLYASGARPWKEIMSVRNIMVLPYRCF